MQCHSSIAINVRELVGWLVVPLMKPGPIKKLAKQETNVVQQQVYLLQWVGVVESCRK